MAPPTPPPWVDPRYGNKNFSLGHLLTRNVGDLIDYLRNGDPFRSLPFQLTDSLQRDEDIYKYYQGALKHFLENPHQIAEGWGQYQTYGSPNMDGSYFEPYKNLTEQWETKLGGRLPAADTNVFYPEKYPITSSIRSQALLDAMRRRAETRDSSSQYSDTHGR